MKITNNLVYYLLIGLGCLLIYFSSLFYQFTYLDDYVQVVENPFIRQLNFDSFKAIFSHTSVGMYQPVTTLIYSIIYSFSKLNPVGFHLVSLLFHVANSILVFSLLNHFFNSKKMTFLLSLIFAFHPMQVESVAWVSAFSTLTYSFFLLLAFLFYLKYFEKKSSAHYWVCLLIFILACLSKSAAVIFPVLMVFYDIYQKNSFKINWWNKLPFFLVSLAFGIITLQTRESAGHLSDLSVSFDWLDRIFLVCYSILFYPFQFIFPIHLSAFYPYPEMSNGSLPFIFYLSPFILLLIGYLIFRFRKKTTITFGATWYFVGIALVLQIIPVGNQMTTDRYIYFPMIGLLLILGQLLKTYSPKKWFYGLFILPVVFIYLSHQRTAIWENDEKLWLSVLEEYPTVSQAYNNLGSYALKKNNNEEAYQYFNKAIQLQPNYADAFSNRGNLLSQAGNSQKAIEDYSKAIALKEHADAYFNRANEFAKLGDFNSAVADYTKSIGLAEKADTYTNRAFIYLKLGNFNFARRDLTRALDLNTEFDRAYFLLGLTEQQSGKSELACNYFKRAKELGSKNALMAYQQYCLN